MTQRIEQLISEIETKVQHLRESLVQEREKNLSFTEQLEVLKREHSMLQSELDVSKNVTDGLKGELEKMKENVVSAPVRGRNDQEIDELVKEIEYCISQLKK